MARVLAIRHHVVERSTLRRLAGIEALGRGGEADLDALADAQQSFDLILGQQVEDIEHGRPRPTGSRSLVCRGVTAIVCAPRSRPWRASKSSRATSCRRASRPDPAQNRRIQGPTFPDKRKRLTLRRRRSASTVCLDCSGTVRFVAQAAPTPRRTLPTWSAHHGWREPSDISRRIGSCRRWSGPIGHRRPCRTDRTGARMGPSRSTLGRASADGRRA